MFEFEKENNEKSKEDIRHVYDGLPAHINPETIEWVPDPYRTHPLSLIPGGSNVIVEYQDNRLRGYDKIKDPESYIRSFFFKEIGISKEDLNLLDDDELNEECKQVFKSFWIQLPEFKPDESLCEFQKIWDCKTSNISPLEAMRDFKEDLQDKTENYEYMMTHNQGNLGSDYDEVWDYWFNEDEGQMYFGECPECNIPDRD